jgi:outer membrane receptor protein involved in Fe transport
VLAEKDDKWHVALWGQNLGDETYRVAAFDLLNNPLVGQYFSMLGAPRTYGVELYYGF